MKTKVCWWMTPFQLTLTLVNNGYGEKNDFSVQLQLRSPFCQGWVNGVHSVQSLRFIPKKIAVFPLFMECWQMQPFLCTFALVGSLPFTNIDIDIGHLT